MAVDFIQLIRFPNLIIVILTQYLIQYLLQIPFFEQAGLSTTLDHFHFALLVFETVLIAAGGYIINDLIDFEIDKINKPEKLIIQKKIPINKVWSYYHFLNILGLMIAIYLAHHVGEILLSLIFPAAVALLFLYSKLLKQQVLIGNLVVALFCAFVPGIVLFAERNTYTQLELTSPSLATELWLLIGGYLFFAFCSTMYREIIKDIEDIEGDSALGIKTLPIVWGINPAKIVAGIFGILLIGILLPWVVLGLQQVHYLDLAYILVGIVIPVFYSFLLLYQAKTKSAFHRLSRLTKMIMVSGLIYLLVWYF